MDVDQSTSLSGSSSACFYSIVLSDHIPLGICAHDVPHDVLLGSLRRTAQFCCPPGVDRAYWDNTIQTVWSEHPDVQRFLTFLENSPPVSVQEEWDSFQRLLVDVLLQTCLVLSQNGFLTPEVRDVCFCAASQAPFKGQMSEYCKFSPSQAGIKHQVGDMAIRKLRRRLARCYELKRLLLRAAQSSLSAFHAREWQALQNRLRRQLGVQLGHQLGLREMVFHFSTLKHQLQHHDQFTKECRLRNWRTNMVSSDAALSRWLKSKVCPVGVSIASAQGQVAETDVQAAEIIFDYWCDFWGEREAQNLPVHDRVESIL